MAEAHVSTGENSGVTYEPLSPSGTQNQGSSSPPISPNLKLATIFFFVAFGFHTICMVTFSQGQDSFISDMYIYLRGNDGDRNADTQLYRRYYHSLHWAGPVIGLLVTSYIMGLVAFLLVLLQLFDDLLKHNLIALYVTLGFMFFQCKYCTFVS